LGFAYLFAGRTKSIKLQTVAGNFKICFWVGNIAVFG